ncbi:MAG: hypothetical protein JSR39_06205 [Verrucomicrobia bacterium]|nr:hypothetical protein [Verrucomicrobiota bacterium]
MVRLSKQTKDRNVSPRRPRPPAPKTGPKKDKLAGGYKAHANAAEGNLAGTLFIPKIS